MTDDRFERIEGDVRYIRAQVDTLLRDFGDHRTTLEGRVSKLEVKAGFWGALAGFLAALGFHFNKP